MSFSNAQKKLAERIVMAREIIGEQPITLEPCALLDSQLNALSIFAEKMQSDIRYLRKSMGLKP